MTSLGAEQWFEGLKDELRDRERRGEPPPFAPERYEILGKIGEGAAAQVYRARDRDLGRTVALKILRDPLAASGTVVERFHREATTAAGLSHPNLVSVYDAAVSDGRPYLVMELVEGLSLAGLLARKTEPVESLVRLVEKVARGVAAAHAQGVVHRDLKPGNILVGLDGEPKVADFGLAYVTGAEVHLTRTGVALGTPLYMAPEQVQGRSSQIGLPTDVYALGVILYEALIGRPPHAGDSVTEVFGRILNDEPVAPRRLNPRLPVDLETIVLKALDKDPARRYPSAKEFADDLRRFLGGEAIHARPPGLATMGRKLVRRHRLPLAIAATVVLATAGWALVDHGRRSRDAQVLKLLETAEPALTAAMQAPYRNEADWPALHAAVDRSRPAIEEAARLSPRSPLVHFRLGLSWSVVGQDARAEACWREAVRLDPDFGPAHFQLGRSLLIRGIVGATGRSVEEMRRNRAASQVLLAEAGREFEQAGKGPGGRDAERQRAVAESMAAFGRNDYKAAFALAEAGLERHGGGDGREMFHLMKGMAGPMEQRVAALDEAVRAAPQDYLVRAVRGVFRQEAGQLPGALVDYNAALACRPAFLPAWLNRAIVKELTGDFAGAVADLDAIFRMNPSATGVLAHRGTLKIHQGDLQGAAADLEKALALDAADPVALFGRGEVKRRKGDMDGAIADYDATIRVAPSYAAAWCNRAGLRQLQGKFEEAIADATESLRLDADLLEARVTRAAAYLEVQKWAEAERDYTAVINVRGARYDLLYGRAIAYAKQKRNGKAIRDMEQALKDAPADWPQRRQAEYRLSQWKKR